VRIILKEEYPLRLLLEEIRRQCILKTPKEEIGKLAFSMKHYIDLGKNRAAYDFFYNLSFMEEGEEFYMEYDEILARVDELLKKEKGGMEQKEEDN